MSCKHLTRRTTTSRGTTLPAAPPFIALPHPRNALPNHPRSRLSALRSAGKGIVEEPNPPGARDTLARATGRTRVVSSGCRYALGVLCPNLAQCTGLGSVLECRAISADARQPRCFQSRVAESLYWYSVLPKPVDCTRFRHEVGYYHGETQMGMMTPGIRPLCPVSAQLHDGQVWPE